MQVTCPHCGKTLKISEPSAAEEPLSDSRTALTPSGVVAIVAVTVGVVGVLAFGFGALLTRPNREAEAKKREVIQQEAAATQHELQTEISRLENANSRSATTITGLRADIDELQTEISRLENANSRAEIDELRGLADRMHELRGIVETFGEDKKALV